MKTSLHSGFTLIELLMVIGIMGLIGSAATTGYYAAVRGMADRGVRQNVISFLRSAQQRALSDEVPTVVFIRNERLMKESEDGSEGDVVCGVLTAVRMAGRISYIGSGNVIVDEFADWDKTYDVGGNSGVGNTPMRMYRLVAASAGALQNVSQCRSYVYPYVEKGTKWQTEEMLMTEAQFNVYAGFENTQYSADDTSWNIPPKTDFTGVRFNGFPAPFGFKISSGNTSWNVGDAYGVEIGELRLPSGYVFGTTLPSSVGDSHDVGSPILFDPATVDPTTCDFNTTVSISIRAIRANGGTPDEVGKTITHTDLEDDKQ